MRKAAGPWPGGLVQFAAEKTLDQRARMMLAMIPVAMATST
jgi:hypothetical protein